MNESDLELIEKCSHLFERYRKVNDISMSVKMALLDLSNDCIYLDMLFKKYEME